MDLSGVAFALAYFLPSNPSSGNWKIAGTIDEGASEEQAQAIDRIVSGQAGGPFADFAPLIGEYGGMQRGKVSLSDGEAPSLSVTGVGDFRAEFFKDSEGTTTTMNNAMFGFAPTIRLGKGSGQLTAFGSPSERLTLPRCMPPYSPMRGPPAWPEGARNSRRLHRYPSPVSATSGPSSSRLNV
jgi:hypothetical protein